MRIAIGQVIHETNTFSVERTTVASFQQLEWLEGQSIITAHEGVQDYIGGMIDQSYLLGINLVPTFSAAAEPSGIIAAETWLEIKQRLLEGLKAAGKLDAICLALHGAGIAEACDDIEGDLLDAIRCEFGTEIPLVATLDLHANMTLRMVEQADLLLGVNFYPHSDSYDRGREAMERIHEMVEGNIRPVMHLTKLPLMIPPSTTLFEPAKMINEKCLHWEWKDNILDCTFFHGFPYTDTPDVGVSVLVATNGDKALARIVSEDLAGEIWKQRFAFNTSYPSPVEGLKMALQVEGQPIMINETSDNPGAGTPGDGTYLLAEMLKENMQDSCFCHICDPETVELAHRAGAGSWIEVEIGGKTDDRHGAPIPVRAYVKLLTDGEFIQTSPMWAGKKVNLGQSARLVVGNVDVIVCSLKSQLFDDELLKLHGIDISRYKVVGIKSSQHFRAFFQDRVAKIITVDSPGLSTFNFSKFDYKRLPRPIYPLDLIDIKL